MTWGNVVGSQTVEHPEWLEVAFVPRWTSSQHLVLMVSLNLPPNYPALIAPSYQHTLAVTLTDERVLKIVHFFSVLLKIRRSRAFMSISALGKVHLSQYRRLISLHVKEDAVW